MALAETALATLAIFPLPEVVLFPGVSVPLHVFEPRYVEMLRDVVAGPGVMALVRLRPGYEQDYLGRPPIETVATAGEVVAWQDLPGDRLAVLVRGAARIAIERELPAVRSYREVAARLLPDDEIDEEAVALERSELVALCAQLGSRLGERGDPLRRLVQETTSTAMLTFALGASLVSGPEARQRLLEERDVVGRVTRLLETVSQLLVNLGPPSTSN